MNNLSIETQPLRDDLTTMQLRQQLGEVLERVHYRFQQFRITRKDKPMARLVNDTYMQAIEQLLEADPALADTVALMLNEEAMAILRLGENEWNAGQRVPLADALAN